MADQDLQRQRARLVRLMHLRALSWDPDILKFRTNEASVADAIERCFEDPLERANGGGDWRGKRTGHIYDACSPGPTQYFVTDREVAAFRAQLEDHTMRKAGIDVVPVDLRNRGLTLSQLHTVSEIIANLPRAAKRKVVVLVDSEE